MVGTASAIVDFAVFNLLLLLTGAHAATSVLAANSAAFACAMVMNYTLNARFSFRVPTTRRSALAYTAFTLFGLALYNGNLLWIRAAIGAEDRWMLNVAKVAAMVVLVVWNYFGYQRFVFRRELRAAAQDARR